MLVSQAGDKEYFLTVAKLSNQISPLIGKPPKNLQNDIKKATEVLSSWGNILELLAFYLEKEEEEYPLSYLKKMNAELFLHEIRELMLFGCVLNMGLEDEPFKTLSKNIKDALDKKKIIIEKKAIADFVIPEAISLQAKKLLERNEIENITAKNPSSLFICTPRSKIPMGPKPQPKSEIPAP